MTTREPLLLPPATLQAVRHYMRQARATTTRRAYAAQWQPFVAWCQARGCPPLPAPPALVAAYLAERAQAGSAVASIGVMLAAIAFAHRAAGLRFERADPALKLVLEGIRRAHVRPQAQAEPLTGRLLADVLAGLGSTPLERRDGALLAVLYLFALRASEAVTLDWRHGSAGRGWLRLAADRAEVVLLGSKAAQGQAQRVVIPAAANPVALGAIRAWVDEAGIEAGEALLRPIAASGSVRAGQLDAASVGGIVRRAMQRHFQRRGATAAEARVQARRFSGHSGRVGLYVTASEAGAAPQHIAAIARHASMAMALRYGRRADLLRCAPHHLPGVGV